MVNRKTRCRNTTRTSSAIRWRTLFPLFSLTASLLLCTVPTVNADSRTGAEAKRKTVADKSDSQTAGSPGVGGDSSEPPAAPSPQAEASAIPVATDLNKRTELNLLGKTNTEGGESRRNENVQFNLIDNNALKELNIRLGTTATLIDEYKPNRN